MKKIRRFSLVVPIIYCTSALFISASMTIANIKSEFPLKYVLAVSSVLILFASVFIIFAFIFISFDEVGIHFFFSNKETKLIKWVDVKKIIIKEIIGRHGREMYFVKYYNKNKKIRSVRFKFSLEISIELRKYYNKKIYRY